MNKIIGDTIESIENRTNTKIAIGEGVSVNQTYSFQDPKSFSYATYKVGMAAATQPWQLFVGIARWINEPRFKILETMYDPKNNPITESYIKNGDSIFVNGILNSPETAIENANKVFATKVAYNPTDGAMADVVEAFLQRLTFTSSIDRRLAHKLAGHKGIMLSGHSQGGIIVSNTLLNLGLRGQRRSIENVEYYNTQITQARGFLAAKAAGVESKKIIYSSRFFDPSNVAAPNFTDPLKFLSGIPGLYLPFGAAHHGIE